MKSVFRICYRCGAPLFPLELDLSIFQETKLGTRFSISKIYTDCPNYHSNECEVEP